jgi:four helix bundle protein
MRVRTFRDLVVWQRAFALCVEVYRVTEAFPAQERYGMVAELRKTARSVVYNIAEGHRRKSSLEYIRFLDIARGSAAELETQLLLAQALRYLDDALSVRLPSALSFVDRMLTTLMQRVHERRALASSASAPVPPRPL